MAVERKKDGGETQPKSGAEGAEPRKKKEGDAPGAKRGGEGAPRRRGKATAGGKGTAAKAEKGAAAKAGKGTAAKAEKGAAAKTEKPAPAEADTPPAKPARSPRARARRPSPAAPIERPAQARPVVRARAKYVRSSARKARLVIDHIRGKSVQEARGVLRHTPRSIARDVEKLLESAVANAENNHELVGDDLMVKEAFADEGPTLKRWRPRARGRASRIRKRTSHLTLTLTPRE
jgi:ribosomal protein L22